MRLVVVTTGPSAEACELSTIACAGAACATCVGAAGTTGFGVTCARTTGAAWWAIRLFGFLDRATLGGDGGVDTGTAWVRGFGAGVATVGVVAVMVVAGAVMGGVSTVSASTDSFEENQNSRSLNSSTAKATTRRPSAIIIRRRCL